MDHQISQNRKHKRIFRKARYLWQAQKVSCACHLMKNEYIWYECIWLSRIPNGSKWRKTNFYRKNFHFYKRLEHYLSKQNKLIKTRHVDYKISMSTKGNCFFETNSNKIRDWNELLVRPRSHFVGTNDRAQFSRNWCALHRVLKDKKLQRSGPIRQIRLTSHGHHRQKEKHSPEMC